jgi:hypothetical protein
MDSSKFDAFTKALATAPSRRHALKTIAATTIGALLGLGGGGIAFAKCHPNGHPCDENSTCCSRVCQNGICTSGVTTTHAPGVTTTHAPASTFSEW